jgi:UDP-N-acetyl-D-mannosaminuronic acid dehydrogenase
MTERFELPQIASGRSDAVLEQAEKLSRGIQGMSFKGESDRHPLWRSLPVQADFAVQSRTLLCTDPYVSTDPNLVPREDVINAADVPIVPAPGHYCRNLEATVSVIGIWGAESEGRRP